MTPHATLVVVALLVLPLGPSAGRAPGAQNPRGLLAQATKAPGCTIETRPLTFPSYDPLAATSVDAQGQVIYSCDKEKNIRIEISRGGSNSYDRRMTSIDDRLNYNVYLDATHRTVWGDGSGGTDFYTDSNPPNNTSVIVTAYGRILGSQDVAAGQYSDTLQVTILF